jgi:ABC-type transport system substrate-binding protein
LAETHSAPGEQKIIAQPLADLILADLKRNPKEKKKFEERLRQMQERFPDNEALDAPAKELQAQADPLIAKVKKELESAGPKNIESIGKLLNEAEEAAPNNTEVRDLRLQLNDQHPTLRVGVRELPSQMSPALARGDSDLRAVELMFESLVNLHSDDKGGSRWEPGLAEGPPRMIPRGRQFQLALNGKWSNGKRIWAGDVRETVSLLKEGKMASRPPVWGDLLEPVSVGEASRVNLRLLQGWLDPLALMNFKIVPSGSAPESPAFAAHPIGSGPFKCKTDQETDEDDGRKCKIFVANPNYVSRPGKTALPHIEEIHFILYNDAVKEMKHRISNRCDMMLDLTAQDEANLQKAADALHIRLPAPAVVNRRIYFLAVNNRRFGLANPAFRLALASAIDRDTLLDKYFRAGQPLHTALNGPYPAKSWACNPNFTQTKDNKQTLDPFNVVKAKANMALAGKDGIQNPILKLEYPEGDPAVKRAMEELCEKVNAPISVTLKPVGVPDAELRRDVETTYSYDLAYYHYDFPDDVYWLGPLLEPRGGPGGQNYLGYNGDLIGLVRDATQCRDFPEVRKYTYLLHDKFLNEEMPFIPLWQLDALSAVSSRVEIPPTNLPFDPVRVFTDVEQWKLNGK